MRAQKGHGVEFDAATAGVIALVAGLLAVVAIGVGIVALRGQRRVRAAYAAFSTDSDDDVLTLLQRHIQEVRGLRVDVAELRDYADALRTLISTGLSRIATVRYDAFDDMGGRLSYSTAILDEHGDGVVLTSINGRRDSRAYAKPVGKGESAHNLSHEEHEAIRRALDRSGRTASDEPLELDVLESVGAPGASGAESSQPS